MHGSRRQTLISRLFVGGLIVLCLSLGALQYSWIGEVSRAEHDRLREGLRSSLMRFNADLNREIGGAVGAITGGRLAADRGQREARYATRFTEWREANRRPGLFASIHVAVPIGKELLLKRLNATAGAFDAVEWPAEWTELRARMQRRLEGGVPFGRRGGPPPEGDADMMVVPVFEPPVAGGPPEELEWLIFKLDRAYLRSELIPEVFERHLGSSYFRAEILDEQGTVLFTTDEAGLRGNPDASIRILDARPEMGGRRPRGGFRGDGPGRGPGPPGEHGRWILNVRHVQGSLDAVVERNRWRNIAIVSGILLLLIAAVVALARYTSRAQRLAELQMQFVAGVSHELRTPLTVMRTAGHNLRQPRISTDATRVERYGTLIEDESNKLAAIVEQVLRFANVNAGRVIAAREQTAVVSIVDEAIAGERAALEASGCVLDKEIAADLPDLEADRTSLRHALQNLISNAAKYGRGGSRIAVRAHVQDGAIEVRIADDGPGIPKSELTQVFEPFFRGSRAVQDQVHGTGLGLSLAKRIIEAHDGSIHVESDEGKGTEFTVRLPIAAPAPEHELSNTAD